MDARLKRLRLWALIFLVIFELTVATSGGGMIELSWQLLNLHVAANFGAVARTEPIVLSSSVVGYLFVLYSLSQRGVRTRGDKAVLALASLGTLGYLNEILRLTGLWNFQMLFTFPPVVALIEWIQVSRRIKDISTEHAATVTG